MAWPPPITSPLVPSTSPCLRLRDDLDRLNVSKGPSAPEHERFFPKSRITNLFTDDRIREVLDCQCHGCQQQRGQSKKCGAGNTLAAITGRSPDGRPTGPVAIVLFALLVYIECPVLISSFLDKRVSDQNVESKLIEFTADHVHQNYWPHLSWRLAEKFHWKKYRFFIPVMKEGVYEEYPSDTILPFVNEVRLGRETANGEVVSEGSYGDVFAFDIVDEYRRFSGFLEVQRFARKQLHANTSDDRFKAEYDNLKYVKKLGDSHLVNVVAAYRHKGHYNIIFPCAETNLGSYLRDPHHRSSQGSESIVDHPIWPQFLGIARGLHKVLDCEEPGASHTVSKFGYHLDLKPANILVEEKGRLVITDFGQATFKAVAGTTSSKVVGMGGTVAYAPPEIDRRGETMQNRRYDIWSLGCILVEICSFVVKGSQGVLELDRTRLMKNPGTNYTDDSFFRRTHSTNTYELKPEVMNWIQQLPQSTSDTRCKEFLNEVLLLALKMLNVDVNSRLTSKEVCILFAQILDRHKPTTRTSVQSSHRTTPSTILETEIGKEIVAKLATIYYHLPLVRYWESGTVHFSCENTVLRLHTMANQTWTVTDLGSISQLRVVLRYALRDASSHYFSDASLYISTNTTVSPPTQANAKFSTSTPLANLLLQELFLGQEVCKSLPLKAARTEPRQRGLRAPKFAHRRSSASTQESIQLELDASSIQIWMEGAHGNITEPAMASVASPSRKQSPRSLRLGPPPPYVVIFHERSIVVIRMSKGMRVKETSQADTSQSILILVPTDERSDPSFPVSVFRARMKEKERLPSLPISRESFEAEEMDNSLECSTVTLYFNSIPDASSFHRSYKKVKKRWVEAVKAFEALQDQVGPRFGYSRS